MKTLKLVATCVALGAGAHDASLERQEAGRAVVGQCYSRCLDELYRFGQEFVEQQERLLAMAVQVEDALLWSDYGRSLEEAFLGYGADALCVTAQNYARLGDTCQAGCVDVELAYGVRAASARTRFNYDFGRDKAVLAEVGLWTGYRTSPVAGTPAFDAACAQLSAQADARGPQWLRGGWPLQALREGLRRSATGRGGVGR